MKHFIGKLEQKIGVDLDGDGVVGKPPKHGQPGYGQQPSYGGGGHQQPSYGGSSGYPAQQPSYGGGGYPPQQQPSYGGYPPQQQQSYGGYPAPQNPSYPSYPTQDTSGGYYPSQGGGGGGAYPNYPSAGGAGGYPPQQSGQYPQAGYGAPASHGAYASPSYGGNRKALLIGINYIGQQGQLSGCVNDVATMRNFIGKYGYNQNNMMVLVDDPSWRTQPPTKQNIINGFRWLVNGARTGDSLFVHYSGHGGQVKDTNGDEADGYDETLIPVDFRSAGQITDDEVFMHLVAPLPPGCRLTAVMDCCHSGTVMDLPYVFRANRENMARVFPNGQFKPDALFSMFKSQKWDWNNKKKLQQQALKFGMQLAGDFLGGKFGKQVGGHGGGGGGGGSGFESQGGQEVPSDVIMFSGCRDNQTSADVSNVSQFQLPPGTGPGGAGGACTNSLVSALTQNPNLSYIALLDEMRKILEQKRFTQVPQLSSSKKLDLGQPFQL